MNDYRATTADAGHGPAPWGPWATLGFGLVTAAAFVLVQAAVALVYLVVRFGREPSADAGAMAAAAQTNGLLLALSTLATAVVCTGLIVGFARMRQADPLRQYLRLRPVPTATLLRWLGLMVLAAVAWDAVTALLGRPVVPVFMRATYATAGNPALFWLALAVAAPVFEELFFRGFLLTGLRRSRLGASGAVLVTALLWAGIHLQYNTYEIASIFLFGLILGAARVRTDSTWTPMLMHGLLNLLSLGETAWYVSAHVNGL